jgi:hypothetical protein
MSLHGCNNVSLQCIWCRICMRRSVSIEVKHEKRRRPYKLPHLHTISHLTTRYMEWSRVCGITCRTGFCCLLNYYSSSHCMYTPGSTMTPGSCALSRLRGSIILMLLLTIYLHCHFALGRAPNDVKYFRSTDKTAEENTLVWRPELRGALAKNNPLDNILCFCI